MITGQEAGSTKPVFVCMKTGPTVVHEQVLLVFYTILMYPMVSCSTERLLHAGFRNFAHRVARIFKYFTSNGNSYTTTLPCRTVITDKVSCFLI